MNPKWTRIGKDYAFGFKASNNEAEYDTLIIDIQLAKVWGSVILKAYCDSQMAVSQVQEEFEVKEASIKSNYAIV